MPARTCAHAPVRRQTGSTQHLAHRGRGDGDAETLELADDPAVSPVGILSREAKDQRAQRLFQRRPPRFLGRVRPRRATSWRCQRSNISGLTEKLVHAGRGSERLSAANSARSAHVGFSWPACRRRIANSCLSIKISSSFDRRGRASSHTSANTLRTTRYTNDHSEHEPPLKTARAPTPPSAASTLAESRERACEPYEARPRSEDRSTIAGA
jgi:hypothetical protein